MDRVFYKRERGPGPSVTAGVPFCDFLCGKKVSRICLEKCHAIKKTENVTEETKSRHRSHCPAEGSKKSSRHVCKKSVTHLFGEMSRHKEKTENVTEETRSRHRSSLLSGGRF